ncbi:MAG: sulfatase-like hydrolase/transferase [Prevotellaceae bacterium]|nr:sulfatase-like hydrolase/transferase [Prevotellaceae bacterium]
MRNCEILFWLTIATLMVPNVMLDITEGMSQWACVANILLPLGIYMLLMSISRKPGKMTWWLFPYIFFAAFQVVLLYLYGEGVLAVDMLLNVVTTNVSEATELLDGILPAVLIVCVLYLPPLGMAVANIRGRHILDNRFIYKIRRIGGGITVAGLLSVATAYLADPSFRLLNNVFPLNVTYNLYLAIERSWISAHYQERVANFSFDAVATHPKDSAEVYVMVIGETARSDNFSLYGYQRDTNPLLTKLAKDSSLIVFKKARTESNTTHKSVPMLLTAATASDYSVLYREKGIIAAFKEAGFHTSFISNQLPNHSFIDFLGMEADNYMFIKEAERAKDNVSDMELLPIVESILKKGRKKEFIVLHTYGSHFKYNERYPRNMAHFLPDDKSQAKYENRQQLVNAYDNTIRFTDYFLYKLSALLSASGRNSAWLYTSDHGENIYDDNRNKFLHASPNPSEYELRVPLLAWTSTSYAKAYPDIISALRSNSGKCVSTSISFFHTMLEMGGIKTKNLDLTKSLADRDYKVQPRLYLNDHNEAVEMPLCLCIENNAAPMFLHTKVGDAPIWVG